jgi:20S proteasome alpha/beta subunit
MTLILAIRCNDRIVIAADGLATDFDTGDKLPARDKMFKLTDNSAILVSGSGLIDDMDTYFEDLVQAVRATGHHSIKDLADDIKGIVDRRDWAEYKDEPEESHLQLIVVGYDQNMPKIYTIPANRKISEVDLCVHGNWGPAIDYLVNNASKEASENTKKVGNKVAIEMLSKATKANAKEIGRPFSIWHVSPRKVQRLNTSDLDRLYSRYGAEHETA